jgi:hypothetical protein
VPQLHFHQRLRIELQRAAEAHGRLDVDALVAREHGREEIRIHADLRRERRHVEAERSEIVAR